MSLALPTWVPSLQQSPWPACGTDRRASSPPTGPACLTLAHLHQHRLTELLPIDDFDGHLLARDTVNAQLHETCGERSPSDPPRALRTLRRAPPQSGPGRGLDQEGCHSLLTTAPHSKSGLCPTLPFSVPRAGLLWPLSALPHSLVTAQDSSALSHVGDVESLPQAFSCPEAPCRGAWVPTGPGGPTQAPPPSTLSLCHPPFSLDRGARDSRTGHGHPGQHTSACLALSAWSPHWGDSPITALLAILQGPWPWPPCHVGRAGCLPLLLLTPCWDRPPPASPSSAQPPASCPLLDCSVAPDTRPTPS